MNNIYIVIMMQTYIGITTSMMGKDEDRGGTSIKSSSIATILI